LLLHVSIRVEFGKIFVNHCDFSKDEFAASRRYFSKSIFYSKHTLNIIENGLILILACRVLENFRDIIFITDLFIVGKMGSFM